MYLGVLAMIGWGFYIMFDDGLHPDKPDDAEVSTMSIQAHDKGIPKIPLIAALIELLAITLSLVVLMKKKATSSSMLIFSGDNKVVTQEKQEKASIALN